MDASSTYVVYFLFFKDCGKEIFSYFCVNIIGTGQERLTSTFHGLSAVQLPSFFYEYSTIRGGVAL